MQANPLNQPVRLRRALLQVSSLLLLSILTTGLLGQFAAWSLSRADRANNELLTQYLTLVDDARGAQAAFKTQVQEWKNVLLRGEDPAERDKYLAAFTKSERATSEQLKDLAAVAEKLELQKHADEISSIRVAHEALGASYRQALSQTGTGAFNATVIDLRVRGIDRALDERINALTATFISDENSVIEQLAVSGLARYRTLTHALWVLMAISTLLVASLLYRMLRDHT